MDFECDVCKKSQGEMVIIEKIKVPFEPPWKEEWRVVYCLDCFRDRIQGSNLEASLAILVLGASATRKNET